MELEIIHGLDDDQVNRLMELYQGAWWATDRTISDVREMLAHTDIIFGFTEPETGNLVAFARVLTDYVYFALIFDVIVAAEHRHKGIGTYVIETVRKHPLISQIQNLELCCREEMKPFYRRCGFSEGTGRMQIRQPRNVQQPHAADADEPRR